MVADMIKDLTPEEKAELAKLLNGELPPPYADGATVEAPAKTQTAVKTNYVPFSSYDKEGLLRDVMNEYIQENKAKLSFANMISNRGSVCYEIRDDIMKLYERYRVMMNNARTQGESRIPPLNSLPPFVVAYLLIETGEVKTLKAGRQTKGCTLIARHYFKNDWTNHEYKWSGQWQMVGTEDGAAVLKRIFYAMCPAADEGAFTKQLLSRLFLAPPVYMTNNDHVVFCRNGIWDMETQTGMCYDDPNYEATYGQYVTLRKLAVNHPLLPRIWGKNPVCEVVDGKAIAPTIYNPVDGTTWNAQEGLEAPFEMDTDVGKASLKIILQGIQFMIRGRGGNPGIVQFWTNPKGNGANGKSTLMDAFARLCEMEIGDGDEDLLPIKAIRHIPIEKLGKDYTMNPEDMLTTMGNFGNESNASVKALEDAALLKTLGRKEDVILRQCYGKPMETKLDWILWIQAINNKTKIMERNGSVIANIEVIPFNKTLDAGRRRQYIITDYIFREEVASYYLWLLTCGMPMYDEYDAEARAVLLPYKQDVLKDSMTTWQYFDEVLPLWPLDCINFEALYDLYPRWAELSGIDRKAVMDKKRFAEDMEQYGCNNQQGVVFSKNHDVVSVKDRNNVTYVEALNQFGTSRLLGTSPYVARKKDQYGVERILPGQINWDMFVTHTKNGTVGKQFTHGVFKRVVSHWDAPIECERVQAEAEAEAKAAHDERVNADREMQYNLHKRTKRVQSAAEKAAEIYGAPKVPDGGLPTNYD